MKLSVAQQRSLLKSESMEYDGVTCPCGRNTTVGVLVREGLLKATNFRHRKVDGKWRMVECEYNWLLPPDHTRWELTPKGREVAKELKETWEETFRGNWVLK